MQAIIGKQFPKVVIPKIEEAKKSIKIVVFDWRWYPYDPANSVQIFNQSLVRASRRGIKIQAVANNDELIQILKSFDIHAKKVISKNLVHAKLMIIDEKIVIIGSHNYTQSAFTMNYEISAMFDDDETAKQFLDFFSSLFLSNG